MTGVARASYSHDPTTAAPGGVASVAESECPVSVSLKGSEIV